MNQTATTTMTTMNTMTATTTMNTMTAMKVGDVAKLVGVTVRTLHHYHQIGLLVPRHLTEGGHRLYTDKDIQHLYQIMALKNFGFTLEEIRDMLHAADTDPSLLIKLQLEKATEALSTQLALCNALREVQQSLESYQAPSIHDMAEIIMMMQMNTKHYLSDEQIAQLKQRYQSIPTQETKQLEQDWVAFIERLQAYEAKQEDVRSSQAQQLAAYWKEFVRTVAGDDAALIDAVHQFHAEHHNGHLRYGLSPNLFHYLQRIIQAAD